VPHCFSDDFKIFGKKGKGVSRLSEEVEYILIFLGTFKYLIFISYIWQKGGGLIFGRHLFG